MAWNTFVNGPRLYNRRYVIAACSYTYKGYEALLENSGISTSRIMINHDKITGDEIDAINRDADGEFSVFLKGDICAILSTLKKTVSLLNALSEKRHVIIYCRLPVSWLYRMLLTLVVNKNKLETVRIASLSLSCHDVVAGGFPVLEDAARIEERLTGCLAKGLSLRELDVVLNLYRGNSVKVQSRMFGLAIKTIYTHRQVGLRKLQFIQPWLKDAGVIRGVNKTQNPIKTSLPVKESEFYSALARKEIFPVYQIITDRHKKGTGFEILLRWKRHDKTLKPVDFLKNLHNKNIWLQLTALVVDAAVRGINKYNGKFYFSVNIPPELASGSALPGMAKKAVEMLIRPEWAQKLVFEFAETIDVTRNKEIPETMQGIRQNGCRLFLDDCFSSDHVMFPVRQVEFDGLKLDRDIVDKFVANESDYNLIKAMQYYSDITGGTCVAEGVDSAEKFDMLAALGLNSFQGYYLSKAVVENELDRMVRQFS